MPWVIAYTRSMHRTLPAEPSHAQLYRPTVIAAAAAAADDAASHVQSHMTVAGSCVQAWCVILSLLLRTTPLDLALGRLQVRTSLFAKTGSKTDRGQTIYTRKRSTHSNKITKMHTNIKHSPERLSRHCEWHHICDETEI